MASNQGHLPLLLLFLLSISLVTARAEWVDYPSGMISDIPVEDCDPASPNANAACRDVCHYAGCKRGGQCDQTALPNLRRFCHCNC